MLTGQTTIGKMTARCQAGADALTTRLRLSQLLAAADIAPPGFPPQAILLVRRVAAGPRLPLSSLRPDAAWERATRDAVSDCYRRAIRPAPGQEPPDAGAVLFQDMGELLACLAADVHARSVERRWYWHAYLRGNAVSSTRLLVHTWLEEIRYLPAALVLLAQRDGAAAVARDLTAAETVTVLGALAREFGLPTAAASPAFSLASSAATVARGGANEGDPPTAATQKATTSGETGAAMPPMRLPRPPWARWREPTTDWLELPLPAQRLLSQALALYHAPSLARSTAYAEELQSWSEWKAGEDSAAPPSGSGPSGPPAPSVAMVPAAAPAGVPPASRASLPRGAVHPDVVAPQADAAGGQIIPAAQFRTEAMDPAGGQTGPGAQFQMKIEAVEPNVAAAEHNDESVVVGQKTAPTTVPGIARGEDRVAIAGATAPWERLEGVPTRIGGLLFLLNLFVSLGLPDCFEAEYRLTSHLSGWSLTELLGRALLAALPADHADDPLWPILAHLDGRRPGEPPAMRFRRATGYRMPARWISRFALHADPWIARAEAGRLRVRHSSGEFLIADFALRGTTPTAVIAGIVNAYAADGLEVKIEVDSDTMQPNGEPDAADALAAAWARVYPEQPPPNGLRRWLEWVIPFLDWLLRQKFDAQRDDSEIEDSEIEDSEKRDGASVAREVLCKRGRLYCTRTHVDLVMAMDQVSLPVRMSGLDANPGWVRDLMRVVTFHYV